MEVSTSIHLLIQVDQVYSQDAHGYWFTYLVPTSLLDLHPFLKDLLIYTVVTLLRDHLYWKITTLERPHFSCKKLYLLYKLTSLVRLIFCRILEWFLKRGLMYQIQTDQRKKKTPTKTNHNWYSVTFSINNLFNAVFMITFEMTITYAILNCLAGDKLKAGVLLTCKVLVVNSLMVFIIL